MTCHSCAERTELVATLRSAGPDAPTLCNPWTTTQLAAHLVLRESSPLAAAGALPFLSGVSDAQRRRFLATHSYGVMLTRLSDGAPWYSPFAIPPLRDPLNLLENVVHHEDVRRAAAEFEPRVLPVDRQVAIWKRLRGFSRLTLRAAPVGVRLIWDARRSVTARKPVEGLSVDVTGDPVELALVAFGRQRVARVDYSGDPDAIARLTQAKIGI